MREFLQSTWAILAFPFCVVGWVAYFVSDNVRMGWRMMEDWDEELWQ